MYNHTDDSHSKNPEILWFVFDGQKLLVTDKLELPDRNNEFIQQSIFKRQLSLELTKFSHIAAELASSELIPVDMQWMDLKQLYRLLPSNIIVFAAKARQLIEWDKSHQFCGECGAKTNAATHEHARTCIHANCHRIFYPPISPVVMVAIERGPEILLARSPHFPPHIYSVLAGFMTPGEDVETAIHREVLEEVGIKIRNLQYFGSQAWPFPSSLMLGFQAEYDSGDIICEPIEIEDAAFFHVNALPQTPAGNVSISAWLIEDFCKRHGVNK